MSKNVTLKRIQGHYGGGRFYANIDKLIEDALTWKPPLRLGSGGFVIPSAGDAAG